MQFTTGIFVVDSSYRQMTGKKSKSFMVHNILLFDKNISTLLDYS